MRKARIENGIVCEVLTADPFPPFHESLTWVDCGPEVVQGWTWDGLRFAAPVPTSNQADTIRALTATLQGYLDREAQTHGYDGILSLCSYAASTHPRFGKEGREGIKFRDAVWAYGYQVLDDCEAGRRPVPTDEELLAGAPVLAWP